MLLKKRYITFILFLFKINLSISQDLTGTWEGDLDNFEFLQVNIIQTGDVMCGYTWDYVYDDRSDYCMAYFTGTYDKKNKEWVLVGNSFFQNHYRHILMKLVLSYKVTKGAKTLEGWESEATTKISVLSKLFGSEVYLKKVSEKPTMIPPGMEDCAKKKKKDSYKLKVPSPNTSKNNTDRKIQPIKTPQKKIVTPKTLNPKNNPKIQPVKIPEKKSDTAKEIKKITLPPPPISSSGNNKIIKEMTSRRNKEMTQLVVYEKNITLDVFDNGIVDSDTVSIFYNGKLILSHQKLSEKPIVIPISLDEKVSVHEITLFAENLGSIPPNTALIVVHAGDKRYELFASASLTENAVIRFEYKPK